LILVLIIFSLNFFSYYTQNSLSLKGIDIKDTITSIAIGGFDGMHLAHQQLFSKLDENGAIVIIQTTYANLSPYTSRTEHTTYPLFFYPLVNIKHLSGKEFISLLKEEFPNLEQIVVGYDFHFGYKAAQNIDDLKKLFDGKVTVVDEYKLDGIAIHSRVIRQYLRDNKLQEANRFLGYNYKLKGMCIRGQGLGSKQFVPTINIDIKDFLIPAQGIYITKTILHKRSYNSVSFIGHRVTTDGKFAVETHIIEDDFDQEIPAIISIEFIKKIRDNKKFESYDALKNQILQDIQISKEWFKNNEKC
jgi:riboflavin kinase/FMN adenylyltransferase